MGKTRIDNNAFVYPMPMAILGAVVDGRPNYMAVAWVSRVNFRPPLIAVACGRTHHTNGGIIAHGQFSLSVPGRDLLAATDYSGIVSGASRDKSDLFAPLTGELEFAPMVAACPLAMECRLVQRVELPSNDLFIGEIAGAYCDERCLTDGKPDIRKIDPFTLTMPDNGYWAVGEPLGRAWSAGEGYRER